MLPVGCAVVMPCALCMAVLADLPSVAGARLILCKFTTFICHFQTVRFLFPLYALFLLSVHKYSTVSSRHCRLCHRQVAWRCVRDFLCLWISRCHSRICLFFSVSWVTLAVAAKPLWHARMGFAVLWSESCRVPIGLFLSPGRVRPGLLVGEIKFHDASWRAFGRRSADVPFLFRNFLLSIFFTFHYVYLCKCLWKCGLFALPLQSERTLMQTG